MEDTAPTEDTFPAELAVKFVKGSDTVIEGLAIPFGGPKGGKDLDDEAFGPDTDFALDWFPNGRPLIYHHGLNQGAKIARQGRQFEHEITDEGIWAKAELDKSARYHATVAKMVADGKLFFSSGTFPHLVNATKGRITQWPWIELSLTPTPANPYAAVHFAKSVDVMGALADLGMEPPAALIAAALKALDESNPDAPLAGATFAAHADRLLADVQEFRVRASEVASVRVKSGRVLSAATRERLAAHPEALRQLANDLDELLAAADSGKAIDPIDLAALIAESAAVDRKAGDILLKTRGTHL